jgi:hypothetical protein
LTLALFDFRVSTLNSQIRIVFAHAEISQGSAEAVAPRQSIENRGAGDGRMSLAVIVCQARGSYELTECQIWIRSQRRLVIRAQVVCIHMEIIRDMRIADVVATRG